jgi:hypothetical protein
MKAKGTNAPAREVQNTSQTFRLTQAAIGTVTLLLPKLASKWLDHINRTDPRWRVLLRWNYGNLLKALVPAERIELSA